MVLYRNCGEWGGRGDKGRNYRSATAAVAPELTTDRA